MARKTPQQKKRQSYLKDRVNAYGEHNKSSRKAVRRHKRVSARKARRKESVLGGATGRRNHEVEERIDHLATERSGRGPWRKFPDLPLAEVVAKKLSRRAKLGIISEEEAQRKSSKLPRLPRR